MENTRDGFCPQSLHEAERIKVKFGKFLDSMPDGIVIVNRAGRIVFTNAQGEKLFGYERGELCGQSIDVLLPIRFRSPHAGHCAGYFTRPHARSMGSGMDIVALRKNGEEFPADISLSPLETEEGVIAVSAIRDITDRKKIEQKLSDQNIELQHLAESKNRFFANMSHELRTPLNSIIGFSEFLVDGKAGALNSNQKEYIGDVLSSGRHLLQLINGALDLAKIEANKMSLKFERFSLAEAVAEACSHAGPMAQKKKIEVKMVIASNFGEVTLDRQRFRQILDNLLSNAIKFTDEGGRVDVLVSRHDPRRFRLSVCDTGIGIRVEDIPLLFREFNQLQSGGAEREQGTGLGLALTRRLVELHGGTIHVESQFGKGSSFHVFLPIDGETRV